jgi:hypothetical protein
MIRKSAKRKTTKKIIKKVLKRARNPNDLVIVDNFGGRPYLADIKIWMTDYMRKNPNYDPSAMAHKSGKYFNITETSEDDMEKLAFDLAEEFEYNKERSRQRKASVKTKGFPLGLGNSPFKKKNPFEKPLLNEITLPEVKDWMLKYIKLNDDYDPRDMVDHAIIHLNIRNVTPEHKKALIKLAYVTADEYEMNRKR